MVRGIPQIPAGYVPEQESQFKTFNPGTYEVESFEWFSVAESTDTPIVVQDNDFNVGRARFKLVGGEDGPPISVTLGEMYLLLQGFRVPRELHPQRPQEGNAGQVSQVMTQIAELCAQHGPAKVEINKGSTWVGRIVGGEPKGDLTVRVVDIFPRDTTTNVPTPRIGQYGPWFGVKYVVTGGKDGVPINIEGARFVEMMSYSLEVAHYEDGTVGLDWQYLKDGSYNQASAAFAAFITAHAPHLYTSLDAIADLSNVLPEIWASILRNPVVLSVNRFKTEKNKIKMDYSEYQIFNKRVVTPVQAPTPVQPAPVEQEPANGKKDADARDMLRHFFDLTTPTGKAFQGAHTYALTNEGIESAQKYLTPLKEAGHIPAKKLEELTFDDIQAIFNNVAVEDAFEGLVVELRGKLAKLGIGVESDY